MEVEIIDLGQEGFKTTSNGRSLRWDWNGETIEHVGESEYFDWGHTEFPFHWSAAKQYLEECHQGDDDEKIRTSNSDQ